MKHYLYYYAMVVLLLLAMQIPQNSIGQCLCEGGITPDSVVQNRYYDSITAVNTVVPFQQFDPSIGTLSCFKLSSDVTTVINFDLYNKENMAVTYRFRSFRESAFSGPAGFYDGMSSSPKTYGPYDLDPIDPVGTTDEVHIGPDTVFNSVYRESYYTGAGDYIGNGNVSFDYLNTSTVTLLQGSSNYDLFVRGYTRMNVQLVYYWCPSSILVSNIKNFTASKAGNNIDLNWQIANDEPGNHYEIQLSPNGRQFRPIQQFQATDASDGGLTGYNYHYPVNQGVSGKLYFRIKQVNTAGKVSYSAIRFINFTEGIQQPKVTVYPNPVIRQVSMQFDKPLKGSYYIEIVNPTGQLIYRNTFKMNNSSSIEVNLPGIPPSGMYLLRGRNIATDEWFTSKLTVRH